MRSGVLSTPKVSNVQATFDDKTLLRLSWTYERIGAEKQLITVLNFNVRLWYDGQTSDMKIMFTGEHKYQTLIDLAKLFPSISYSELNAEKVLSIEVRVRESEMGLGQPEILRVPLSQQSLELVVAASCGVAIVFILLLGNFFQTQPFC